MLKSKSMKTRTCCVTGHIYFKDDKDAAFTCVMFNPLPAEKYYVTRIERCIIFPGSIHVVTLHVRVLKTEVEIEAAIANWGYWTRFFDHSSWQGLSKESRGTHRAGVLEVSGAEEASSNCKLVHV